MKDNENKKKDEEKKEVKNQEKTDKDQEQLNKRKQLEEKLIKELKKAQIVKDNLENNPNISFVMPKQTFLSFLLTLLIGVVIDYILFISITGYKPWLEVEPASQFFLYFSIFTISFSIIDTSLRSLVLRFFPKQVIMSGGTLNILITMLAFIGCSLIPNITIVSHWDVLIIILFLLIARGIINHYINRKIVVTIINKKRKK